MDEEDLEIWDEVFLNDLKETHYIFEKSRLKNDLTTIIYENIDKSVSVGKLLNEINKYLDASTNKENR